jgi:hypothetical protein
MDLIDRLALARYAPSGVGVALSLVIAFAVFVMGAPTWILVPISLAGATVYAELRLRALRHSASADRDR